VSKKGNVTQTNKGRGNAFMLKALRTRVDKRGGAIAEPFVPMTMRQSAL